MPRNDRLAVCAQVEDPKTEPRVEPKPDPTGKHMYATKVRLCMPQTQHDVVCFAAAVTMYAQCREVIC